MTDQIELKWIRKIERLINHYNKKFEDQNFYAYLNEERCGFFKIDLIGRIEEADEDLVLFTVVIDPYKVTHNISCQIKAGYKFKRGLPFQDFFRLIDNIVNGLQIQAEWEN